MESQRTQPADLISLVGAPRTPIPRIPAGSRQRLKAWIAEVRGKESLRGDPLVLRACLAVGESPWPQLTQASVITTALEFRDILRFSRRLSRTSVLLDASEVMKALEGELDSSAIKTQMPNQVVRALERLEKGVGLRSSILSENTEYELLNLVERLIRKLGASSYQIPVKGLGRKRILKTAIELSLRVAAKSSSDRTFFRQIDLLRTCKDWIPSSVIEEVLEDLRCHRHLEALLEKLPHHLNDAARAGRVDKMRDLAEVVNALPMAESMFLSTLNLLWKQAARYSEDVQRYVNQRLTGQQALAPKSISLVEQGQALEIQQLAAAVLASWEARDESSRSAHSFKVLREVAERFFGVKLSGEVGEIVDFDPTVHDFQGARRVEKKMQIARPSVEWQSGSVRKVIVRAIVRVPETV